MSDHDAETGEIYSNGAGARASMAASVAKLEMQRSRMNVGENCLHDAIALALTNIPIWIKAATEGNRGKYANLKDILQAVRPPLAAARIRLRQGAEMSRTADEGGGVKGRLVPVYTDLIHVPTGMVDRTIVEIPISVMNPQAMGSAITYGKRYSLLAALGLASDEADDDGAKAMPVDLTQAVKDSAEFEALVAEIKGQKDISALTKFVTDGKTRKRIDGLSEGEQERLRIAYSDFREALGK